MPLSSVAQRIHDRVPMLRSFAQHGHTGLEAIAAALGAMIQPISDAAGDSGPAWSALGDPDRIPPEALAWLAQFVGVRATVGAPPHQQRTEIRQAAGWQRGTPGAMRAAVAATLTGARQVVIRERYGSAWVVRVEVLAGECPDPAASLAAAIGQKPAGLVLQFAAVAGQNWDTLAGDAWDTLGGDAWDDLAST